MLIIEHPRSMGEIEHEAPIELYLCSLIHKYKQNNYILAHFINKA